MPLAAFDRLLSDDAFLEAYDARLGDGDRDRDLDRDLARRVVMEDIILFAYNTAS